MAIVFFIVVCAFLIVKHDLEKDSEKTYDNPTEPIPNENNKLSFDDMIEDHINSKEENVHYKID